MYRTDPLSGRSQIQIWGPKFNHLFVFSSSQLLQECKLVLNVYWTCWTTHEFKKNKKFGQWTKLELVVILYSPLVPNFIHFPLFYIFLNLSLRIDFPPVVGSSIDQLAQIVPFPQIHPLSHFLNLSNFESSFPPLKGSVLFNQFNTCPILCFHVWD